MIETPPASPTSRSGPLAGVKILDMSTVVLGPLATLIFADLGAEVIKVETPSGDLMRGAGPTPAKGIGPIFAALNRGKACVVIDAATPEGKGRLTGLLREADVFFHNVRMEGMARLGFDYEAVRAINPRIIYAHCAGYGPDGPYAKRQAFDDLIQAVSGFADLNQRRDGGEPTYSPSLVADKTVGLFAAYATLAALYSREKTGKGQFVQVPMFEAFSFFNLVEHLFGETFIPATGPMGYVRSTNVRRRPYATLDGHIGILPYSDDQWRKFFEIGGRPGVYDDPRFATYAARTEHTGELYALIEETAASRTTDDWLVLLDAAGIPAMRYNPLDDVLEDPHLTAAGFFQEREDPALGRYRAMRHPVTFSGTPLDADRPPQALGASGEARFGET